MTRPDDGPRIDQAGEERLARMESLRALAALGVLVGHAWGFHWGFGVNAYDGRGDRVIFGGGYGVFLFFALSGYLLFRPLLRATFGDGGRIDFAAYARNRVLRILPLYYAVVIVLLALGQGGAHAGDWWRYATFTQNFFSSSVLELDSPAWSLIVEVQFYALLPLLAIGLAWLARRDLRAAAALLVAGGLAALGVRLWLIEHRGIHDPRVLYSLAANAFYFVPGLLLAVARLGWERRGGVRLRGPLGSSDAWALAAAATWLFILERWDVTPLAAVACLLTLGAVALPLRPGRFVAMLDLRALAAVGVVSYSLYLWHLPLEEAIAHHGSTSLVAMFGLAVPASLAVAFVSYRVVEAPFLRLRRRWVRRAAAEPVLGEPLTPKRLAEGVITG